MQQSFHSVALVKTNRGDSMAYLLRRTSSASSWQFIVGNRLEGESFRETAIREVAWQLQLDRNRDFIVSTMAQLSVESVETINCAGAQEHLAVAFYPVHIYRDAVLESLQSEPNLQWVSAADICAGKTPDGEDIDSRVVAWIKKWDILPAWQH
jgi:NUDIX domain